MTIKDLAKKAGVSVGTASMALNGKEGVNEQTRQRVLQIAEEMGYKPNRYARFLTSKKTNVIGLIVTDITNPFFGVIIDIIQQQLAEHGYDVMLGISGGSISKEKNTVHKFINLHVDGIISVPSHKPAPDISHYWELQQMGIPICFITTYYNEVDAPCVMTDLSAGAYTLTKYLLDCGHRKICYLVGDRAVPVSNLRVEGYLSAYRESSFPFENDWIIVDEMTFEGGYRATEKLLSQMKPDAILTGNDFMAMGVLKQLKERGLKVPSDISVAGYDDLLYSSLLETPLTTVRQPVEQICSRAVSIMLDQLTGERETSEKILLKPELIVRESTKKVFAS